MPQIAQAKGPAFTECTPFLIMRTHPIFDERPARAG